MTGERATDFAIIGGGIVGCTLAYDLASRGATVTIFDRRELAREASRASAGIISAPSPRSGEMLPIALRSFQRYPEMIADIEQQAGFSTGWHKSGMTILASDDEAGAMKSMTDWYREHGIEIEWLDQDALREREPAVSGRFVGGLLAPDVASLRLDWACRALAATATQMGTVIRENEAVLDIEMEGGKAVAVRTVTGRIPVGFVIVAAGAWSRVFGDALDVEIPTVPVRGQMLAVSDVNPPINSVLAHDGVYLVPRADGTIAAGATEEPNAGFDDRVTPEGVKWLTDKVALIAPPITGGKLEATWAGLRPGTVDGRPIIGPVPRADNAWVVTGHFRSGALLAPGTSELVTESIYSGAIAAELVPFLPR